MTRRLPLILSSLALIVALSGVGVADAARAVKRALFASNAAKVNGIAASKKPVRNRLLPLGANGKFPASVMPSSLRGPRGPAGPPGPAGNGGAGPSPYVFRAHKIAAQDILAQTSTRVVIGAEDFDPHGDYDPAASRYTAPVTGYYQFSSSISVCCAAGRLFSFISTSRAGMTTRGTDTVAGGSEINRSVASGLLRLQAGDTVEVHVYTGAANTMGVEDEQTFFSGYLVSTG